MVKLQPKAMTCFNFKVEIKAFFPNPEFYLMLDLISSLIQKLSRQVLAKDVKSLNRNL